MLSLPERVPEPPTLSLTELQALTVWKRRYTSEAKLEIAGLSIDEARRLRFLAWAYDTGRITP